MSQSKALEKEIRVYKKSERQPGPKITARSTPTNIGVPYIRPQKSLLEIIQLSSKNTN